MPLQLGSSGPMVAAWQATMLARFKSYALAADGGPLRVDAYFGYDDAAVQREYERRTGQFADGVVSDNDLAALKITVPFAGTCITAQGTGVDMWTGYPADTARAVGDRWYFQPLGDWPAAMFPMGPSVQKGIASARVQIRQHPGKFVLAGYSQGAIVTSMVYKHDLLDPFGMLHDRLPDLVGAVTWGNPCREKGVANGNKLIGEPIPDGRGISDDRLVNTPDWWLDFAHGANGPHGRDIYTDTPDDDAGEDMTAIYKLVQNVSGVVGANGLLEQVTELVGHPFSEGLAMFRAIYYGGQFVASNPATLPHISYDIDGAVRYLRGLADRVAA